MMPADASVRDDEWEFGESLRHSAPGHARGGCRHAGGPDRGRGVPAVRRPGATGARAHRRQLPDPAASPALLAQPRPAARSRHAGGAGRHPRRGRGARRAGRAGAAAHGKPAALAHPVERRSAPLISPAAGRPHRAWSVALGQVAGQDVLASGSADGTVRLWDAATGDPAATLQMNVPECGQWRSARRLAETCSRAVPRTGRC